MILNIEKTKMWKRSTVVVSSHVLSTICVCEERRLTGLWGHIKISAPVNVGKKKITFITS